MDHAFAVLLVIKGAKAWYESKEKSQNRVRSSRGRSRGRQCRDGRLGCNTGWESLSRRRGRMTQDGREAILAIKNVAHGPDAGRAHGFTTISTIARRLQLRMDSTLHGVLLRIS